MGLSLRFSKDSTLPKPYSVLVGEIDSPIHYALFAFSQPPTIWYPPSQQHQPVWFRSVANNSTSRRKIHNFLHFLQKSNAFDPFPKSWPIFPQISTSVTKHPLLPAMREFKTSQTSTVHPVSSCLPHITILFIWKWKVSFHQFNIQLRLLLSPSSPNSEQP
ncbi:hypothetical protein AVEN_212588-1 [Araneus ventricosus]|uniref:Uncharacterized protein n=1 Tax=Araneus ventricosus TaxID=182803 RepID=A0A4Y2LN50_ARAVE|nr:hypothetical protein AVEN_212588-1 [Araneus ventricosus]